MAESTAALLLSNAAKLSAARIWDAIGRERLTPSHSDAYRVAGGVATRLHLIRTYIDSLPPYWIDSDVEQLCCTLLDALRTIVQPTKASASHLFGILWSKPTDPETSLITFFRQQIDDARKLQSICDDLLSRLTSDNNDAVELPDSALQLKPPTTWDDIDNNIFKTLQSIASCNPSFHETNGAAPVGRNDSPELRHQARLCLHEPEHRMSASRNISILISAMNMNIWQEFLLEILLEGAVDDEQQTLEPGGFCPILEENCSARLILEFKHGHGLSLRDQVEFLGHSLLKPGPGLSLRNVIRHYELTPKDKVVLSYAVAQAYYKYYDSELMQIKWTSDTIWFMSEVDKNEQEDQLPLRAYIPLPPDLTSITPLDVTDKERRVHQCPRIFDLAVLLLAIGLAKPFEVPKCPSKVQQANLSHMIAKDELSKLEKIQWSGLTHKSYFDSAIRFCLDEKNFVPPRQPKPTHQGDIVPVPTWREKKGILARRKMLYRNVVRPLRYLLETGFKGKSSDITYIGKKPSAFSQEGASQTLSMPEPEALFHSDLVPKMWFANLKKISQQVEQKRQEYRVTATVRVAILDTGLDKDFPAFKTQSGLIKSVTDEKDFAASSTSTTMDDTFGHGTLMARLVMECAPSVEILVVRVAVSTDTLQRSQNDIKDAILWAGQTGKADIISMSFGFPSDHEGIRDAIETVRRQRKENIIFFASAGNLSTDDESFPARHPDVISVRATDCHGAFLQSNSVSTTNGAAVLGTYGDPDFIREEFSTMYPNVCQPGSSVATAIMAGIAATMLAYASVLPLLVPLEGKLGTARDYVFQHIKTTKGMEAVLHRLTPENTDHPRLKAVNPMWFWKNKASDMLRQCAIVDALSDVDRRSPRTTRTG